MWRSEVAQSCETLCDPVDCNLQGSSIHGIFQARVLEWVLPFPSLRDLPCPVIQPGSPTLQADALPSEPPAKPMGIEWVLDVVKSLLCISSDDHKIFILQFVVVCHPD